jgi:hypothetical protein
MAMESRIATLVSEAIRLFNNDVSFMVQPRPT